MSNGNAWMSVEEYRDLVTKNPFFTQPEPPPNITSLSTYVAPSMIYIDSPEYERIKRLCFSKGLGVEELIEVLESLPNKGVLR